MAPRSGERVIVLTGAKGGIGYHRLSAAVEDRYRIADLDIEVKTIQQVRDRSPARVSGTTSATCPSPTRSIRGGQR